MDKQKATLPTIFLVGLTVRTNNKNEMNPAVSKIGALVGMYWGERIANKISHRSRPGVTFSVYTNFESDEHGDYTYFIGEAVESVQDQDLDIFETLTIPASDYQKFTTPVGKMPDVIISAWQEIWKMKKNEFGGRRTYIADFEIYDERAVNPENTSVDIYIGIESDHNSLNEKRLIR